MGAHPQATQAQYFLGATPSARQQPQAIFVSAEFGPYFAVHFAVPLSILALTGLCGDDPPEVCEVFDFLSDGCRKTASPATPSHPRTSGTASEYRQAWKNLSRHLETCSVLLTDFWACERPTNGSAK